MSQEARLHTDNRLLAALPTEEYERIAPYLEPVELGSGQILYHSGQPLDYIYFPLDSMVSLVAQMAGGAEVEVGVTGFEGVVGLPALLGVEKSPHLNMTQMPGGAVRARAAALREELGRGGTLLQVTLR